MSEDSIYKSAVLLTILGEEEASEVIKYLGPKDVQKLGGVMATLSTIKRDQAEAILDEFIESSEDRTHFGQSMDEYIRSVLTKALGTDKASNLIDRILHGGDTSGIEGLKWMDSGSVAELIRNEHPQIIATILVHLDRDQAGEILGYFTDRMRNDVMLRIATLEGIQPAALRELNDVLRKLLAGSDKLKKSAMGGIRTAAEILNFMGSTLETSVLNSIREYDGELAQQIQDQMFTFDNLMDLDDRSMQRLLREIQNDSLIVALKGTSEALKNKIFKNMSSRASEMLKEDLEAKGPVKLSEVETEQREILKIVRALAEEGEVVLAGKGDDGLVE